MLLEQWGCWIAYHDPHSHQVFWYNHETSGGQWEEPAEIAVLRAAASSKRAGSFEKVLPACVIMMIGDDACLHGWMLNSR